MNKFPTKPLAAVIALSTGMYTGSHFALAEEVVLEEVIVTVERKEQSLQDYAGVAQAFNQDALDKLGVGTQIQNLQNIVPGMNIANQEGNIEVYIRGVGSSNNTELGDPGAATHVNGVYIPRPRGVGSMFFDLERVEVNKGPQGTLRGRNATAGSLNIVAKKPDFDGVHGNVDLTVGNFSTRGVRAAVNLPVSDDLAFRAALLSNEHDPYFENASPNSSLKAAGEEDNLSVRLSMLWNIGENTSLYLVADQVDEEGTGYPGAQTRSALLGGSSFEDVGDPRRVLYRGQEGELDSVHKGVMATLTHDFGSVALELSGSFRDLDFYQRNASNDGIFYPGHGEVNPENYSTQIWDTRSESKIFEARLYSTDEGPLSWTSGVFYFDEDQQAGLFSLNDFGTWYSGTEYTMPDVQGESTAFYIDGSYDIDDKLSVYGGVRYTREEKSRFGIGGNWAFAFFTPDDVWGTAIPSRIGSPGFVWNGLGRSDFNVEGASQEDMFRFLLEGVSSWGSDDTLDDQLNCVLDPNCNDVVMPWSGSSPIQQRGRYKDSFVDFRVGASYQLDDDSMVYATISTGHKSGGFNDTLVMPDGSLSSQQYDPESLVMYEVGSKNEFQMGDVAARLNASAFYYDYSDQVFQVIEAIGDDDSASSLQNVNVANSEIFGLELEGKAVFANQLVIDANVLFLETEIKDGSLADTRQAWGPDVPTVDLSGNRLPVAPEVTINLALSQVLDTSWGSFDWIVSAQYRSDYFLSIWNNKDYDLVDGQSVLGNDPQYTDDVDGYVNLDAGIGANFGEDARFRIELFGANLTDEVYSSKGIIDHGNNLRFTNLPRTYGMRLKVNF
ncbi:TonB-dependent receptor [Pseudoteredinibacter isoporae]|uniref:TonB-dependent receptor n=1 Tax=Pseudoteredinibacter isoporae TaxID=570281 RepID=UPI00310235C7